MKIFIFLFCLATTYASAQKNHWQQDLYWLEGNAMQTTTGRISGLLGLNYAHKHTQFSVQLQFISEELFNGANDQISTLNFMFGKTTRYKIFFASASAGLGAGTYSNRVVVYTGGSQLYKTIETKTFTLAIPFEGKVGFRLGVIGLYLKAGALLNAELPSAYFGFGLDVGKLY